MKLEISSSFIYSPWKIKFCEGSTMEAPGREWARQASLRTLPSNENVRNSVESGEMESPKILG